MEYIRTVSNFEELDHYITKGYVESIDDFSRMLGTKETKTRALLKNAPRIELNEKFYQEYNKSMRGKVYRFYYNQEEALKYMFENELIKVYYHDPRRAFTEHPISKEEQVESKKLTNDIFLTKILLNVSMSITDIIIQEYNYNLFVSERYKGKQVDFYVHKDDYNNIDLFTDTPGGGCRLYKEIFKTKDDIFSKNEYVKYSNMIKRGFYIRFQIGKGYNRYIHSVRELQRSELKCFVTDWIKDFTPSVK